MDFSALMDYLTAKIYALLAWIGDLLLWIPRKLYEYFVDIVLYLLSFLPDPGLDYAYNAIVNLGVMPWFGFIADLTRMDDGLRIIFTAYLFRFILRRIPGIG